MNSPTLNSDSLPGIYQSANQASLDAQTIYFNSLLVYLVLLVTAALVAFIWPKEALGAIASAALFLVTLGILVYLRVKRPDDLWYNGRAVAESVKTRSWRWCMRAEPYQDCDNVEIVSKQFVSDLKSILNQNRALSEILQSTLGVKDAISSEMKEIRALEIEDRLEIYKKQRIKNQSEWYAKKSQFNKRRARQWFWASVSLHALAIMLLLYRIYDPASTLPIEVVATAAGATLTWLQAKKHNELQSSYALAAHEIILIKGEALSVKEDATLSEFVVNSEAAFSREHTQWVARKSE